MINWLFVTNKPSNAETVAEMNSGKTSSFCKAAVLEKAQLRVKEGSCLNYGQTAI